ncbi:MAG TPA: hypothetical protein ENH96_04040 [Chlamydiae bacterium]|nr:hypothetical protein [Chlamydiota bacterium]
MSVPDLLGISDIGTSVARSLDLVDKRQILEDMIETSYSKSDIELFIGNVEKWYPVYEDFGKNKIYPESSFFWRILTYIPYIKNASGFESFERLGKDAASRDIDNLKTFLRVDIPKKITELNIKIIDCQISADRKRSLS